MSAAPLVAVLVGVATVASCRSLLGLGPLLAAARTRGRVRADLGGVADPRSRSWTSSVPVVRRVARRLGEVTGGPTRARRRADRALPELLDRITRHLRTGTSLPVAVRAAAAAGSDEGTLRMAEELDRGAPLVAVVEAWNLKAPSPARDLVAAALTLAAEAGGSVASVLDGVTDTLRDRIALEREVAALSSQARASAAVLLVAPVVFSALAAAADRRVAEVLLGSPLGWACLAAGVVLDGAGAVWMTRLLVRAR